MKEIQTIRPIILVSAYLTKDLRTWYRIKGSMWWYWKNIVELKDI